MVAWVADTTHFGKICQAGAICADESCPVPCRQESAVDFNWILIIFVNASGELSDNSG